MRVPGSLSEVCLDAVDDQTAAEIPGVVVEAATYAVVHGLDDRQAEDLTGKIEKQSNK